MQHMKPHLLLAMLLLGFPAIGHSATEDDHAKHLRQFQHGRDLVAHCRAVIHDAFSSGSCETRAVWWGPSGCCIQNVPLPIQWGAQYQMLVMEYETGNTRLPMDIHAEIKEFFQGSPDTYCGYWSVDCRPLKAVLTEKKSMLDDLDAARNLTQKKKR
jgi:hypothetical protein